MHPRLPADRSILCVVGARPNYMKMSPLIRAFAMRADLPAVLLVHTGQHYDVAMSDRLFAGLGLRAPDINLEVGSATHAVQTAEIMRRFEPIVDSARPRCVVVVGDVNSTLACSLVAAKKGVPVIHVEAGLRSFDRSMPEEINRVLTDQMADVLYTTEPSAADNLLREGIPAERIHFVGNVMIDSLTVGRVQAIPAAAVLAQHGVDAALASAPRRFGLVTLHRPSNVDSAESLSSALTTLRLVSERLVLVCPLHPRTRDNIHRFGLSHLVESTRIVLLPPQGYLETLGLMADAAVVLTDSGGIQEETTALGVPCLTMRDNTERPVTVEQGTNVLVGRNCDLILAHVDAILAGRGKRGCAPALWDGHASERIAAHLAGWLSAAERIAA